VLLTSVVFDILFDKISTEIVSITVDFDEFYQINNFLIFTCNIVVRL
jgi:hypothetical protein